MKEDRKDKALRQHVIELLRGGAHARFDEMSLAFRQVRAKARGIPHSLWMLLEHMRIAQWDILEFSREPKHVSPQWPEGYWPGLKPRPAHPPGTQASSKSSRLESHGALSRGPEDRSIREDSLG